MRITPTQTSRTSSNTAPGEISFAYFWPTSSNVDMVWQGQLVEHICSAVCEAWLL
jgi:hypothetical protein